MRCLISFLDSFPLVLPVLSLSLLFVYGSTTVMAGMVMEWNEINGSAWIFLVLFCSHLCVTVFHVRG